MRVLITGATGYIGSSVLNALLSRHHDVLALARSPEAIEKLSRLSIPSAQGDIHHPESVVAHLPKVDAVIHIADPNGNPEIGDRSLVLALLNAMNGTGKALVYTSSTFVYGDTADAMPDETVATPRGFQPWRNDNERDLHAATVRGVRSVVVRPPLVYGRGGGLTAQFLQGARTQGAAMLVGQGDNRWSTVHVDDLADLYVLALEHAPAGSVYNAASGTITMRALMTAIAHAAKAPGGVASLSLEEAQQAMGPLAIGFVVSQEVNADKARRELHWAPRQVDILQDLTANANALGASA